MKNDQFIFDLASNNKSNSHLAIIRKVSNIFKRKDDWIIALLLSMKYIALKLDVSRIYIFHHHSNTENQFLITQIFEWTQVDIPKHIRNPLLQKLDYHNSKYKNWILNLMEGKTVQYNMDKLPDNNYGILSIQDIKSLLMVPIFNGHDFWGFIGIDECKSNRDFNPEEVEIMLKLSKIISCTFKRRVFQKHLMPIFPNTHLREKGILVFYKNTLLDANPKALDLLDFSYKEFSNNLFSESLSSLQILFSKIKNNRESYSHERIISGKLKLIELDIYYNKHNSDPNIHIFIIKESNSNKSSNNTISNRKNYSSLINLISQKLQEVDASSIYESIKSALKEIGEEGILSQSIAMKYNQRNLAIEDFVKNPDLKSSNKLINGNNFIGNAINISQKFPQNFAHLKTKDIQKTVFYNQYSSYFEEYQIQEFIINKVKIKNSILIIIYTNKYSRSLWNKHDINTFLIINALFTKSLEMTSKEEELIAVKKSAQKIETISASFLERISREALNPISNILGYTDLMAEETVTQSEKENYNRYIQTSGIQICSLLNKVKEMTQIMLSTDKETRDQSVFKIEKIINQAIKNLEGLAITNETKIITEYSEEIHKTHCFSFPEKITSIITNILENAIILSPKGTVIFKVQRLQNIISFSIKDSGPGLKRELSEKIYEQFFKINYEGYPNGGPGLGLTIAKNHLDGLGGRIWYESIKNRGCIFYFTIPCNQYSYSTPLCRNIEDETFWSAKTILVFSPYRLNYYDIESKLSRKNNNIIWTKELNNLFDIISLNNEIDLVVISTTESHFDEQEIKKNIYEISSSIPVLNFKEINEILNENNSILNSN